MKLLFAVFVGFSIIHFAKFAIQKGKILSFVLTLFEFSRFMGSAVIRTINRAPYKQRLEKKIKAYNASFMASINQASQKYGVSIFDKYVQFLRENSRDGSKEASELKVVDAEYFLWASVKYDFLHDYDPPTIREIDSQQWGAFMTWIETPIWRCSICMANPFTWGGLSFLISAQFGFLTLNTLAWLYYSLILSGFMYAFDKWEESRETTIQVNNYFSENVEGDTEL